MTDPERINVNRALEQASGNFNVASRMLKLNIGTLSQMVYADPELAAKWSGYLQKDQQAIMTPEETIARDSALPAPSDSEALAVASPSDQAIAAAITKEDAKFRQGLSGFKFTADEMDYAVSLQQFYGGHFTKCVEMLSGSLTMTALRLDMKIQWLLNKLTEPFDGDDKLEKEKMYWNALNNLLERATKIVEVAQSGTLTRAKIEMWRKQAEAAKAQPNRNKPSFAPLQAQQTQIHVSGESVSITTNEKSKAE